MPGLGRYGQELIYEATVLKNDTTLEECRLFHNSTVRLVRIPEYLRRQYSGPYSADQIQKLLKEG